MENPFGVLVLIVVPIWVGWPALAAQMWRTRVLTLGPFRRERRVARFLLCLHVMVPSNVHLLSAGATPFGDAGSTVVGTGWSGVVQYE